MSLVPSKSTAPSPSPATSPDADAGEFTYVPSRPPPDESAATIDVGVSSPSRHHPTGPSANTDSSHADASGDRDSTLNPSVADTAHVDTSSS